MIPVGAVTIEIRLSRSLGRRDPDILPRVGRDRRFEDHGRPVPRRAEFGGFDLVSSHEAVGTVTTPSPRGREGNGS
jgi:hypothetical protein